MAHRFRHNTVNAEHNQARTFYGTDRGEMHYFYSILSTSPAVVHSFLRTVHNQQISVATFHLSTAKKMLAGRLSEMYLV